MANDEENDPKLLAQKAFSVYCDQVLRDAVEKNERLQAQNAKMETTREKLIHMVIYNGRDEIFKINLENPAVNSSQHDQQEQQEQHDQHDQQEQQGQQQQSDASSYLVYEVDGAGIQFPYNDISRLSYAISDVFLGDGFGGILARFSGAVPRLIVHEDNETVQVEFFACSDIKIIATLTNFSGTIQNVKEMMDSNRFMVQFSMMGMVSAETGQPVQCNIDNSLDGAMVSLNTVVIKRNFIHDVLLRSEQVDIECLDEKSEDQEDDELHLLARASKKHQGLFTAAADRKELKARNMLLQESRDLFQTVTGHTRDNTARFQLRLDQGHREEMMILTNGEDPSWVMRPVDAGGAITLEFSAIAELRLKLANVPWGSTRGPVFVEPPRFSTDGSLMILKYTPHVEAVFCFDDSLEHADRGSLQGGVFQHAFFALVSQQEYQGPNFTMKLISIHIRLHSIKSHLDALGIDYSSSNKDE